MAKYNGVIKMRTDGEESRQFLHANDCSEYTYASFETTFRNAYGGALQGAHGGGAFTVASAVDGIYFQQDSGNISSGTITLYKVV